MGVVSSPGYTLDSTPPEVGVVFDGPPLPVAGTDVDYWTGVGMLEAHWAGFTEPHSQVVEYWWAVGTCAQCADVQPFTSTGLRQGEHHSGVGGAASSTMVVWVGLSFSFPSILVAAVSASGLALSAGATYYVSVRACNSLGLCAQTSSDGATLDATPPTTGRVWDGLLEGDLQYQPSS